MMWRKIRFSWWYLPATVMFALLDYKWAEPCGGILKVLVGGVEESGGEILSVPMGRWLFVFGWIFLAAGLESSRAKRMLIFECYRYRSFGKWWSGKCLHIQGMVLILYMEMAAVWYVLEVATGRKTEEAGWILLTFGLHMELLVTVEICFDVMWVKGLAAGVLLVAAGMGYVLAEQAGISCMAGGMFVRSGRYMENGFSLPVMYGVEIVLMVFCYTGVWMLGKNGMLGNRLFGKEEQ